MINVIPENNGQVVVYRGKASTTSQPGAPGDPALSIDGQRVPIDEFDAWYTERMLFDWRGQPFLLTRYEDDRVYGHFLGGDSYWAQDNGLEGNRYDGWSLEAPEAEIDNVRVVKTDLLERRSYKRTFKRNPPEGLFDYVRPATDQEWIKE